MELEFRGGLPATTSCDCTDEEANLSGDLVTGVLRHPAPALTNHETGLLRPVLAYSRTGLVGPALTSNYGTGLVGPALTSNCGTGLVGPALTSNCGTGLVGPALTIL